MKNTIYRPNEKQSNHLKRRDLTSGSNTCMKDIMSDGVKICSLHMHGGCQGSCQRSSIHTPSVFAAPMIPAWAFKFIKKDLA